MAYSSVEDLLIGKIPLPVGVDPQKYVDDATDEVDSYIGFTYVTPVDVSNTSNVDRPVRLLLKRVTNMIATGRLILAMASGAEMQKVHAYGRSLIRDALDILTQISEGKVILTSVPQIPGTEGTTAPMIANVDPESNVEAFYNRVLGATGSVTGIPYPYAGYSAW
jgi:phage gp36-like protein